MQKYLLAVISPLLFLATGVSSQAETDLTGTWTGEFKGIFINVKQAPSALFSVRDPEARRREPGPEFMTNPLTVSIKMQKENTLYGHWTIQTEEGTRRGSDFVCAMTNPNKWHCVDPEGTTDVEVLSETEMKICHFVSGSPGQGAGCAMLKKQ